MKPRKLALLALLAYVTSCSTPDHPDLHGSDHADSTPTRSEATSTSAPALGGVDLENMNACQVLPDEVLMEIGVAATSARDLSNGVTTSCYWLAADSSFSLDLVLNSKAGLDEAEAARSAFQEFDQVQIGGLAAVRTDPRGAPTCRFWVGVSADQSFSAGAQVVLGEQDDLCVKAEHLAGAVVDALRVR